MRPAWWLGVGLLALAGCATAFPSATTESVDRAVTLADLRRAPAAFTGRRVILGGEIIATRPRATDTEVEVLGRRLTREDRPELSDRTDGRFLARTREFLDPAVYAEGRRLTVVGVVAGEEARRLGEHPYAYPVIEAEAIRLWPREIRYPGPYPYLYPYPYPYPWLFYRAYPYPWAPYPPAPWPYWW